MPEKLNLNVSAAQPYNEKSPYGLSEREKAQRMSVNLRPPTLAQVLAWIDGRVRDVEIAQDLKDMAKKYPTQALTQFIRNFQNLHNAAHKKRRAADSNRSNQDVEQQETGPDLNEATEERLPSVKQYLPDGGDF